MRAIKVVLSLAILQAIPSLAAWCRSKTQTEVISEYRQKESCPQATPTSCKCVGNEQDRYNCPGKSTTLWGSTGNMCVKARADRDGAWNKHTWDYPWDYGKDCGSQPEPGSYHCTLVKDTAASTASNTVYKSHSFTDGHSGYNTAMNNEAWCTSSWCFVDPCTCDKTLAPSSWFVKTEMNKGVYFSYAHCGGVDTFTGALCNGLGTSTSCGSEGGCVWDLALAAPTTSTTSSTTTTSTTTSSTRDKRYCRSKTWNEIRVEYRAKEGCPNANPTSCSCTGNQQNQYNCPAKATTLWDSNGKKCVKARSDKDTAWAKHSWDYPATYGQKCDIHPEPGSYHCTKRAGRTHSFTVGHSGYNAAMDSEAWCTAVWCFIDPCSCNQYFAPSSWFAPTNDGKSPYYSYQICGAVDTFTAASCTGLANSVTCGAASGCVWDGANPVPTPAPPPAFWCRGKSWGEIIREYRAKEGCPNANPSTCTCSGNQQTQYNCPGKATTLWDSNGKKCVKARSDKDASWAKHSWDYPATYGEECGVHPEPGSYHCTLVVDTDKSSSGNTVFKRHSFTDGHSGYNTKMDSEAWCTAVWCFVDVCNCDKYVAPSSWFVGTNAGKGLYYSYQMCGGVDTFTAQSCSSFKNSETCKSESSCLWTNSAAAVEPEPVPNPAPTPAPPPPRSYNHACKIPCCRRASVNANAYDCNSHESAQSCSTAHGKGCYWVDDKPGSGHESTDGANGRRGLLATFLAFVVVALGLA